jgi:hypothetical protein
VYSEHAASLTEQARSENSGSLMEQPRSEYAASIIAGHDPSPERDAADHIRRHPDSRPAANQQDGRRRLARCSHYGKCVRRPSLPIGQTSKEPGFDVQSANMNSSGAIVVAAISQGALKIRLGKEKSSLMTLGATNDNGGLDDQTWSLYDQSL